MLNIFFSTRRKVIDTNHRITSTNKRIAQVRTQKSGSAKYNNPRH
jgi:hypothetical protein